MSKENQLPIGYFSLICATAFWGGNFVLGKLLSNAVPPVTLTFLRWFPALLILLCLFFRQTLQSWHSLKSSLGVMWLLGILGVVIFPASLYQGLQQTSALNASLYLAVVPVLVLLLNLLVFKESIKPIILLGAVLSLIGVTWLLSRGEWQRLLHLELNYGDLWAILSAMSWAIYCCVIRFKPHNISNTVFLTALVGLAVLNLLPFFIYELYQESVKLLPNLTISQWSGIAYLIIGPSILSYAFWNYGITIVGNAKGAVMTNFTPLFAAIFSILFLGESIQSFHVISTVFICVGVLICSYKKLS